MKLFIINKLDKRHTGYNQFTHYIVPVYSTRLEDKLRFFEWRNWCWATWGPGYERDIAMQLGSRQFEVARWAWHTEDKMRRLYFASQKELNWFVLTWATDAQSS